VRRSRYYEKEKIKLGEKLTDYAVDIRYPLLLEKPTMDKAKEAIDMAVKIKEFVSARLPVKSEK